jgi:hypothetical protein
LFLDVAWLIFAVMVKAPKSRRPRINADDCTIPPPIPDGALPNLLFKRDRAGEQAIRKYMEWQANDEKVAHAERVATEVVMGRSLEVWDVRTDKGRWWVVTNPTNLYSQILSQAWTIRCLSTWASRPE